MNRLGEWYNEVSVADNYVGKHKTVFVNFFPQHFVALSRLTCGRGNLQVYKENTYFFSFTINSNETKNTYVMYEFKEVDSLALSELFCSDLEFKREERRLGLDLLGTYSYEMQKF